MAAIENSHVCIKDAILNRIRIGGEWSTKILKTNKNLKAAFLMYKTLP